MSKLERVRKRIKEQEVGQTGRRVLLVEGVDDVDAFTLLLNRQAPGWERRWVLAQAEGKTQVLALAGLEPNWLCIVDRDELADAVAAQWLADHDNLMLLPRFCIESFACVPRELWAALPPVALRRVTADYPMFEAEIVGQIASWRRHAALWNVVNPLFASLMAQGFNRDLLNPELVPDDAALNAKLQAWSEVLDPAAVFAAFQAEQVRVLAMAQDDFMRSALYAKRFYPQVVHQVLNRWLGQASEKVRLNDLFKAMPMPPDLNPLWSRMFGPASTTA